MLANKAHTRERHDHDIISNDSVNYCGSIGDGVRVHRFLAVVLQMEAQAVYVRVRRKITV